MDSTNIVLQTWRPQIRCFSSIGLVRMWPYPTSPFAVPHRAPLPSPTEIGGLAAGEGNEIWGNSQACIRISGNGATDNKILGNLIGPVAGTGVGLFSSDHGILIDEAAKNWIGNSTPEGRNIIGGNGIGIELRGAGAHENKIQCYGRQRRLVPVNGNADCRLATIGRPARLRCQWTAFTLFAWDELRRNVRIFCGEHRATMNVTQETVGNVLVVGPEGKLDSNSAKDLESVLLKAMDEGAHRILLDFSSLVYISSSGLGVILSAAKRVKKQAGRVALCRLNDNIQRVFELSGLHRILDIEGSREAALSKYF